ncbi:MAG TPA: cell division protein FtsZ [Thermoplasmata archaeon]|nr:cell division protein FtsZ [Thermoplasmata archaeon]
MGSVNTTGWGASVPYTKPRILVVGCGGAGGNSVGRLHRLGIAGAKTAVINTDRVHLDAIEADRKLLIGRGITRGMGTGGRPELGERCAELADDEIRNLTMSKDLVFLTVGLGGGTGTGVAPYVAEIAAASGAIVIGIATTPFRAERGRIRTAELGIQRLRANCDSLIVLDNNRLLDLVPNLPVERAFAVMDILISEVIKGVTEAINLPSLINLDFNDVRTVLSEGGTSTILYGENSIHDPERVVDETLSNPLLDVDTQGARAALVHISSGPSLSLRTAFRVVDGITEKMQRDANVIFGVRVDPRHADILRVIAILTGLKAPSLDVPVEIKPWVEPANAFAPFPRSR